MFSCRLALFALLATPPADAQPRRLEVEPAVLKLMGSDGLGQLVVTAYDATGRPVDVTGTAVYTSEDPSVVATEPGGSLRPVGDGTTRVTVHVGELEAATRVEVSDFADARPVHFSGEVVPVFSKLGCNSGNCHGKASGQNGFRLSLLGFEPRFDYEALVREARGRRVFPAAPAESLLLRKVTARVPHGGGAKLEPGSPEYRILLRWIAQGTPFDTGKEPHLLKIAVSPERRILARNATQQLRVTAQYDDGTLRDVTRLARYQSNAADLAEVDERGRFLALQGVGEAAVMVRFGGQVTVARATIPLGADTADWTPPESRNLIDPFVFGKLKELGISPSGVCTDAEFARRSSVDLCGVLPRPEEIAAFEADPDPEKRARWVDRLLDRPEYADFFAMKWSAILRNKRAVNLGGQATADPTTFALHAWIRQSLAENKPYDRFAAEILAAKGEAATNPPVALWRLSGREQEEFVDDTAQLFLGLRIQCARCHHHPFEKWSQDDYYGYASFFSRIGRKMGSDPQTPRVFTLERGMSQDPLTNKTYAPKPLDGPELKDLGPRQDPREALADWMRRPDNPFFAKALVNRYWKHFFNRGLVEPEDDMRVSNPPTNPELLDALAADFVTSGYDLKHLVRTIATSRAYDRSSEPNERNAADRQNFARFYPRRLPAEVLLDALNDVMGSEERFAGLPRGFRAIQLPDEGFASYFLDIFGRPKRESVCECERTVEANLSQTLHLLSSGEIQRKVGDDTGRATRWAADGRPDVEKVDELYRLCIARPPTDEEREVCLAHLARRKAENKLRLGYEDLLWTLVNTKEFQFVH